ncbi:MAG: amino acid ABC transporter ATP-binding protein [Actinomycetota bacterium]|nr:amino acid ABC transporter ATP-binding protein [Actinomycetota bacterium]
MPAALVDIVGAEKRFGSNQVLRGIDLSVAEHEVISLIGASGSGKSTLLRCVNGLEALDAGSVTVAGIPVIQDDASLNRMRRSVGIVFQNYNLFPHMTVVANVALGPRRVLGLDKGAAVQRADQLLARIGLLDKRAEYPDRLSGGQQQRVAIVRALAMQPRLMLLDEVTSALDPALVGEVLDMVRELVTEGMTLLLATHEMGFAREISTSVAFLHEGRIVEQGTPERIFDHPGQPETRTFLKRVLAARRL